MNSVIISGTIYKDVEIKRNEEGIAFFKNLIQVKEKTKNDRFYSVFVSVQCGGALAEKVFRQCKKGTFVICQGKIKVDSWMSNGEKKYSTNVSLTEIDVVKNEKQPEEPDNSEVPTTDFASDVPAIDLSNLSDDEIPF